VRPRTYMALGTGSLEDLPRAYQQSNRLGDQSGHHRLRDQFLGGLDVPEDVPTAWSDAKGLAGAVVDELLALELGT